jgi:hypothetical protein
LFFGAYKIEKRVNLEKAKGVLGVTKKQMVVKMRNK